VISKCCGIEVGLKHIVMFSSVLIAFERISGKGDTFIDQLIYSLPECIAAWVRPLLSGNDVTELVAMCIDLDYRFHSLKSADSIRSDEISYFVKGYAHIMQNYKRLHEKMNAGARNTISGFLAANKAAYTNAINRLGFSGERMPTYWLYLFGATGVGKTEIVGRTIRELAPTFWPDYIAPDGEVDMHALKYAKMNKGNFWNGFNGQMIVYNDDFGAIRDDPFLSEILVMCGCDVFLPDMASLNDAAVGIKGTPYFSEMLITTSNSITFQSNEITNPKAVLRRRCAVFKVKCDDRVYSDDALDVDKLHEFYPDAMNRKVDWPHLSFVLHKRTAVNEQGTTTTYTFREFINYICENFKKFRQNHVENVELKRPHFHLEKDRAYDPASLERIKKDREILAGKRPADIIQTETFQKCHTKRCFECHTFPDGNNDNAQPVLYDEVIREELEVDLGLAGTHCCDDGCDGRTKLNTYLKSRPPSMLKKSGDYLTYDTWRGEMISRQLSPSSFDIWCDHCRNCDDCYAKKSAIIRNAAELVPFEQHIMVKRDLHTWTRQLNSENYKKCRKLCDCMGFDECDHCRHCPHCRFAWQISRYYQVTPEVKYDYLAMIRNLLGITTAIWAAYKLYQSFDVIVKSIKNHWGDNSISDKDAAGSISNALVDFEGQASDYNRFDSYGRKKRKEAIVARAEKRRRNFEGQGSVPIDAYEELLDEFEKHASDGLRDRLGKFVARIHISAGKGMIGGCWLLKSRMIAFPDHYLEDVRSGDDTMLTITFRGANRPSYKCLLRDCLNEQLKDGDVPCDWIAIWLPVDAPSCKDNMALLASEKDISKIQYEKVCMLKVSTDFGEPTVVPISGFCVQKERADHPAAKTMPEYYVQGFNYYCPDVTMGYCGFPLIDYSKDNGCVLGAHQGRFTPTSRLRAQYTTREQHEAIFERFVSRTKGFAFITEGEPSLLICGGPPVFIPPDALNYHGRVQPRFAVQLPTKSRLIESPLSANIIDAPWRKPGKEPSILSSKDERHHQEHSPLFIGLEKFKVPDPLPVALIERANEWDRFEEAQCEPGICRLFTDDEVLNGIEGMEYVEGVNIKSSPGWPAVKMRKPGVVGKENQIGIIGDKKVIICAYLTRRIADIEAKLKSLILPSDVFSMDVLKDEKLKLLKIENSMSRLFNVLPTEFIFLEKRYFGAYNAFYHRSRDHLSGSPGMNVRSMEWDEMWRTMREVGFTGFDGDFKEFDGVFFGSLFYHATEDIDVWYQRNDPNYDISHKYVRMGLTLMMMHCRHIAVDAVVSTHSGTISGRLLTAVLNCKANAKAFKCAFIELIPNASYPLWKSSIRIKVWGDDHIVCVAPELSDSFNGQIIGEWFGKRGIGYTPADKSPVWSANKPLMQLEYLKSKPFVDPKTNIIFPKFEVSSVDEIINWISKPSDGAGGIWEQMVQNCIAALQFVIFDGRVKYDKYRDCMMKHLAGNACDNYLLTFDENIELLIEGGHYDVRIREAEFVTCGAPVQDRKKYTRRVYDGFEVQGKKNEPEKHYGIVFNPENKKYLIIEYVKDPARERKKEKKRVFKNHAYFDDGFEKHASVGDKFIAHIRPELGGGFGVEPNLQSAPNRVDERPNTRTAISHNKPLFPIQETGVSYENIATRKIVVDQFEIGVGDVEGTVLKSYNLPMDLVKNCQQEQGFTNMYLWRGTTKVTLLVSSTQFHQGMVCMFFIPCVYKNMALSAFTTKTQWSNIPCIGYIDLNKPQPLELTINFAHPRNYIDSNAANNASIEGSVGTLMIGVFDTLQSATGSTSSVSANLMVEFPDSKFYLPVAVDSCTTLRDSRATFREVVTAAPAAVAFEKHGNRISNNSKVINVYSGIDNSNIGTEIEGDAFEGIVAEMNPDVQAHMGGSHMDKPFAGGNPPPLVIKASGYMNNKTQIEFVDKLTNEGNEQCPAKKEHFSREDDEMSLRWMQTINSFATEVHWDTTQVAGTQLLAWLLTPSPINTSFRAAPVADVVTPQTILDYLSGNFTFWNGRLRMHLKILGTKFQTGMLRVSIVYGKYDPTATPNESNCQFMTYIDLKEEKREYNFETEFPTTTPYLRCTSQHWSLIPAATIRDYAVGTMYIHIINPLVAGSGTPNNVSMQMFFCAPNANFFFLRPASVIAMAPVAPMLAAPESFEKHSSAGPDPQQSQAQMSEAGITIGTKKRDVLPVIAKTNVYPTASLRDLIRRYHWLNQFAASNGGISAYDESFYFPSTFPAGGLQIYQIMAMYVAFRGGNRYKVFKLSSGASISQAVTSGYWVPAGYSLHLPGTGANFQSFFAQTNADDASVMEVETSFTTEYNFLLNNYYAAPGDPQFKTSGKFAVSTSWPVDPTNALTYRTFWAGDDTFRTGLFVGPPVCTVKFTQP